MSVLIIHGPNMNLLGSFSKNRMTLDKLNRNIKNFVKPKNVKLKIFQTHDVNKYITLIQRNRNKVDGIILNLGPLHSQSELISDTLSIVKHPFRCVEIGFQHKVYAAKSTIKSEYIIMSDDILENYKSALKILIN